MTTVGIIFWIIFILLFIGGGIALVIYGLHKHEDKGEKTTTHKIMIGIGAVLIIIGVILSVVFIFKYRRENRSGSIIQTSQSITDMAGGQDLKSQRYGQSQLYSQGYGDISGFQGMNHMNPGPYNAGFTRSPYGIERDMSSYGDIAPPMLKHPFIDQI